VVEHEWWTKCSRGIGGVAKTYDFPPHVVDVATTFEQRHVEEVDGALILRDSPWDPIARHLPIVETGRAQLVTHQPKARSLTNAGPLDPDAFWPFVDTIGGSRWPGHRGGPLPT
jgi:acetoacetate decarboxylase